MKPQVTKSDYVRLSDEELVHRYVQRQDRAAISTLFERYGHLVFGVCLNHFKSTSRAKEATEKIFMKLMEDLFKFKIEQFKPWLFLFVTNYCLSSQGSIPAKKGNTDAEDLWAEEDREIHEKLEHLLPGAQIETVIAQLNKEERTCIDLFYKQKLTYGEIAGKTRYSVKEINKFLQHGKRNLRDKLRLIVEVRK
jgi:RNA polymerase sigma factor (sigma-70 family)